MIFFLIKHIINYFTTIGFMHKLIYRCATVCIEVKDMTTNITQAQVDAHNRAVISRIVARHVWAQTSRMDTPTRHSTWNR